MVRVGDLRSRSSLLEAHVRAQVITKRVTEEGEVIPIYQEEIKVGGFGEDEDRLLLFWPTIVVHRIDSESPFYSMSSIDLLNAHLELVVVLEGVVESTGMTTQLRTSYLPNEILWGRRFVQLSSYKSDTGHHVFDFDLFHSTFLVETPLCSAQEMESHQEQKKSEQPHGGHMGIVISDCCDEGESGRHRSSVELTLRKTKIRRAIDSSDDFGSTSSSDEDNGSDSEGQRHHRRMCTLKLPGLGTGGKKKKSSTCTCSTNVSDSNV